MSPHVSDHNSHLSLPTLHSAGHTPPMESREDSLALATLPPVNQPLTTRVDGRLVRDLVLASGTGRTLHEVYSRLGLAAEKHANRAAHKLGLGPTAVARRIQSFFEDGFEREAKLSELREQGSRKLEKDCVRLMEYALSSESPRTQLQAFNHLTMLTTHSEREFHRNFAAACVADGDVSRMVEEIRAEDLVGVDNAGETLSLIERLLVAADSEGRSKFSSHVAIRYLGGILGLASFWVQGGFIYEAVVKKILGGTQVILRDLGLDSLETDEPPATESDPEGIDILGQSLLCGIQSWMLGAPLATFTSEFWYPGFRTILQLLRRPMTEGILPASWAEVTSAEWEQFIPTAYKPAVLSSFLASVAAPTANASPASEKIPDELLDAPGVPEKFHVLPLLLSDLPNTTITISTASLRPDDRGKEVLDVTMYVDPGNSQGWAVQKKLSDVLSLSMRQSGKKGLGNTDRGQSPDFLAVGFGRIEVPMALLGVYLKDMISTDLPTHLNRALITFLTKDVPERPNA
ncbi:hypothetical protein DFH09DRAFT_1322381 [Mycena vulgaris]|nr:hypothetical protein DFH09DRAFT_1322381 [Mycena vulgaris]